MARATAAVRLLRLDGLAALPAGMSAHPDMESHARVSHDVRDILLSATPLIEPVSLDEAYLDLAGTASTWAAGGGNTRRSGAAMSAELAYNGLT